MIRFTEHAKNRLAERNITKDQIVETVNNPDVSLPARNNRQIAIKKFEGWFLKVVFIKDDNDIIVITNHWISKIKPKE